MYQVRLSKEEKTWAMFGHLSGLVGYFIPFANLLGPFILWQLKKDEMDFASEQAKESLNFQISMTIYLLIAGVSIFILIGFVLLPLLWLFGIIMLLIASVKANDGNEFRYPLNLRFIR